MSSDSCTFSLGGDAIQCEQCGVVSTHVRISNEVVANGSALGILGIARLDECGHILMDAWLDPVRVAQVLDSHDVGPFSLGVGD